LSYAPFAVGKKRRRFLRRQFKCNTSLALSHGDRDGAA